jgi:hypothetical protein
MEGSSSTDRVESVTHRAIRNDIPIEVVRHYLSVHCEVEEQESHLERLQLSKVRVYPARVLVVMGISCLPSDGDCFEGRSRVAHCC